MTWPFENDTSAMVKRISNQRISGNRIGNWTWIPIRTGSCEKDESILLLFISVAGYIDIFSDSTDCAVYLGFLYNWKFEKAISC